jgi:hypothetical protein
LGVPVILVENLNRLLILTSVCKNVQQNIKCRIKRDRYFVDKVETQLKEKSLRGSQTQDIHYSEDKTNYKAVALT